MKTEEKQITLDEVVCEFNPYHSDTDAGAMDGAIGVNGSRRQAFNDLFVTIMDPEHEDVRKWDKGRWANLVALAQDFNSFLRSLDIYYRQQELSRRDR